ncbi:MAG: flagellar motor switch protein FliG, partial [Bdellovibrionales bacterium]|nr:flagellar motor switch protein FliG [Bdellovibrionales bacterium]
MRLMKVDDVNYESLRGFEKGAILMNYLGPGAAKILFKYIDDGDIRKLLSTMQKFRIVPVEVTKKVLEEYYEMISESQDYIFSDKVTSKETVVDAVGEERARGILGHLNVNSPASRNLESLEMVDAKSLSNFLINEHPQTIAVILAHLEPEKKGEVLKRLPEALQAEVVLRLSSLDHVAPELIAEVDQVLKRELSSIGTVEQASLGGVQPVAEM